MIVKACGRYRSEWGFSIARTHVGGGLGVGQGMHSEDQV